MAPLQELPCGGLLGGAGPFNPVLHWNETGLFYFINRRPLDNQSDALTTPPWSARLARKVIAVTMFPCNN